VLDGDERILEPVPQVHLARDLARQEPPGPRIPWQ
jgi:hypothetical protein